MKIMNVSVLTIIMFLVAYWLGTKGILGQVKTAVTG